MCCLILKLQGPKLEKCRSYHTKRYNNALRPNILWGALWANTHMIPTFEQVQKQAYTYNKKSRSTTEMTLKFE